MNRNKLPKLKVVIAAALLFSIGCAPQEAASKYQSPAGKSASHASPPQNKAQNKKAAAPKSSDLKRKMNQEQINDEESIEETSGEEPRLTCAPQTLKQNAVLTLSMKQPHGGFLEIVTPDDRYVFLSLEADDEMLENARENNAEPFFTVAEFVKLDQLELNTAEATTIDYLAGKTNGKYNLIKIFDQSGKYKIKLSQDSFEQDEPQIEGECEVEFTNL